MRESPIFDKLRSGYAWVLFAAILFPTIGWAWLAARLVGSAPGARDGLRRRVAKGIRLYARWSPLYRFELTGADHVPASGSYVLVANHESGLDILCLFLLATPARFLSASWVEQIPVVGPLFRLCEHIPLDPGDADSRARAYDDAVAALEQGTPVAVFPEGRIPEPGTGLAEFRPGAFAAAQRAGVPLVPVVLVGTGKAWAPRTAVVEGTHRIHVQVLPQMAVAPDADPADVAASVREQMTKAAQALA